MIDDGQRSDPLGPWRKPKPFLAYSPQERVAVFIDFENLVCGAGKGLPGQSDPVPAKAITHLCRSFHGLPASVRRRS